MKSAKRILIVFGTRPEGIKMMPLIRECRSRADMEVTVCVTGQHRHMLDQVFTAFTETADIDLDIMTPNQSLSDVTAIVLSRIGAVLAANRPDIVLVHGDTTTALATAMAAFYARVPIGHVEAGLRTHDLHNPWPEEFNRVAIDAMADLMFAPTDRAARNLAQEYNQRGKVVVTGNTGIDALLWTAERINTMPSLAEAALARLPYLAPTRRLVLVTGHRRESFGRGFEGICDGLRAIAARDDVQLIYPVHLNPKVQSIVHAALSDRPNIHLIAPIDHTDMVYLMQRSALVITDSGGMQEEAPALGKPVLVMRDVTERPEALEAGAVVLVGTNPDAIRRNVDVLLDDPAEYARRAKPVFPFGDGHAASRIADSIAAFLQP